MGPVYTLPPRGGKRLPGLIYNAVVVRPSGLPSAALLALLTAARAFGVDADAAVRLLSSNCLACHGAAKMSGLDLRSRETALAGGSRGPALAPGKPAESLLMKAISAAAGVPKMPPGKQSLDPAQVETMRAWIAAGAPWTATAPAAEPSWWSFRKPVRPPLPASRFTNPVDRFLDPKEDPAGRRTLIRRLSFALHGLPPAPEEVEAFVNDPAPDAWDKLVDRYLASPRYGERWGRLWLDVVRYADTGGYETDVLFAHAWRYRDYVIQSFNDDKPYDVFIKEQIAADEIWPDNFDLDGSYDLPESKRQSLHRRLGTMLYTLGAFPVENSFYGDQYRSEWQAEAVETTASAFLGLTFGCARCHDHKFDPITQRDFYRLSAIFAGSDDQEVPITSQMRIFEYTRHRTRHVMVDQLRDQYLKADPRDKDTRETLLRRIGEEYVKAPVMYDRANLLVHVAPVPDTHVLVRGDWKQKGEKVSPGFPASLGAAPEIREPDDPWFIPRRRKALAEWLASPGHPLTARVMVNRIWQGHFGRGIVGTPNDFGRQGEPPSNQPLLDWLAVEFMESGWSVKKLHKLILTSNAWMAKRGASRLDAESIRDAVLAVSGSLNLKMGGPPVTPALSRDELEGMRALAEWPVHPDRREHDRRSVYLFVKRSFRLPMMELFDAPDTSQSCARRDVSTVAPQALAMMNSEWMVEQAARLARRVEKDPDPVASAFHLALGRPPSSEEAARGREFAGRYNLARFCLMLFNLNEFVYVD